MAATAVGKPGMEDVLLARKPIPRPGTGSLRAARELTQRAMESAEHNDAKETAAVYQAAAALREVESGDCDRHAPMPTAP